VPLPDKSADILIYSHVLEHVEDPAHVLEEARRILKDDGVVFIEVPNALHYADAKMFDYFYWFGMREHINHFDAAHLSMRMEISGFETVVYKETIVSPNASQLTPDSIVSSPLLAGNFQKICKEDSRREMWPSQPP